MTRSQERWEKARRFIGDGTLSVIMPAYSLEGTVAKNISEVADLFESRAIRTEIVCVDDGSPDATGAEIERFASEGRYAHVAVTPVVCRTNGGKGAALRAGFAASKGEYVLLLDGDLDINPKRTAHFFEVMENESADIVIGSKRHPKSVVQYPWHRRFVSWAYFTLVRMFVGLDITDTQTGMKLFRREILGEALARMLVKAYAFDLELLAIAHERGAKIAEAPVRIKFGSKFGALKPRVVREMAWDSLAVFYRLKILKYYAKAEAPAMPEKPPLVSVVIPCPNWSRDLDETMKGLLSQTYANWEAIILPDAEVAIPDAAFAQDVRIVSTGKVRPAEKRNIGIKMARGSVIAFIDDDAYPDSRWIEDAVRYFGDPQIGAVGGPGITPPGDSFMARIGGRVYESFLVSGNYRYRYKAGGVRRDVDDYPSCNLFVRKDILEKTGGYRTDFWPGEDTLLCKDIVDSGSRIVYDPWVIVYHHRRPLFGPHLRQLARYAFHRGYFVKRYPSNSLHPSYFVPSAFVAYLLAWAILSAAPRPDSVPDSVFRLWQCIASAPAAVYFALAALFSFSFNPAVWILTFAGTVATHLTYGVKFMQGLVAKKAPCEFIGKDHA